MLGSYSVTPCVRDLKESYHILFVRKQFSFSNIVDAYIILLIMCFCQWHINDESDLKWVFSLVY